MAALRPNSDTPTSTPGTRVLPTSPNAASLSASPASGHTSPGSPTTSATSTAATALPSDEEVEAVIKQATSTRPMPDGRPPPGKDTRTQLFAGNLPYRVRWQDLKDLFRRSGTVLRADVSLSPDNRSRGYGTVLLASAEDAGRAVDMFNGYNWQGRVLEVRLDRLGAVPGAEIDAIPATIVPAVGIPALSVGVNVSGMNANAGGLASGALNGLHVPSPHPALQYAAQQSTGASQNSPVPPPSSSSLAATLSGALPSASPLNSLSPNFIVLQQQQQQQQQEQQERERELLSHAGGAAWGLDSFLGTFGRGLSIDIEKERQRSSLGMRSLFVGNIPFHCQWQDLKDLFRQAGTILRADVSLGPDGRSRGFGTVTYANEIDAERAVVMFNGFDYNGRTLKVHYDKFSAQSPLPPSLSAHPSTLTTPVQPAATSSQAALLQVAQLQQLVSGQTLDRYGNFSSSSADYYNSSNSSTGNASETTTSAQAQTLDTSLHALQDALQRQSSVTAPDRLSGTSVGTPMGGETSASPFSHHVMGASLSLAERRQKVPPPIGSVSGSSSRHDPSSGPGVNVEGQNNNMTLSTSTSSALPTTGKRPAGQSLPASSASAPIATSAEGPATSSSVPTLSSTNASASTSTSTSATNHSSHSSTASSSASPRSTHPAHPGPISLPPPPPVSSFPVYSSRHHPLSPRGHHMTLPAVYGGHPPYGPMSPMHSYPLPAHMHPHNMTPHGLPPITPSMPSFSFVPQPSPNLPAGGSNAIPPTPAEGGAFTQDGYTPTVPPGDSAAERGMGMMPMMSPPLHFPQHVFQPFTPGATMSPGAYYGRPNGSAPRGPYLNPAVGSPVLVHPSFGFPHPGSQPGSPYYQLNPNGGPYGEEPSGYFPPVNAAPPSPRHEECFPPVSTLGSSGLANEILRDGSTMNMDGYGADTRPSHERSDSGSVQTSSENGPGEDTDAERARSSSSGATSWRSSDENAVGAANVNTSARSGPTLDSLASDMASVRLGPPPRARTAKRGDTSYAAAAVADTKKDEQCAEPDAYRPAVRHNSLDSEGARRPTALHKAHSDESAAHVRLNVDEVTTLS